MNVIYFLAALAAVGLAVFFFVRSKRKHPLYVMDPKKFAKKVLKFREKMKKIREEAKTAPTGVIQHEVNKSMKNIKRLIDEKTDNNS